MCRKCEQDPYLAGKVIFFTLKNQAHVEDPTHEGPYPKRVWVETITGPYVGRCIRHHKNWITVRTAKGKEFVFPPGQQDERLLAYLDA